MLILKPEASFVVQETGESYPSAYMRIGEIIYDVDGSAMRFQMKFYLSKEEFENTNTAIINRWHIVPTDSFESWFGLIKLNQTSNILRRIYEYLIQIPGLYPGEFVFADWLPDLT